MKNDRKALFDIDKFVDQLRYHSTEVYTNGKTTCIDPLSYEFFVEAQKRAFTKKFKTSSRASNLADVAFDKFLSVNLHIGLVDMLRTWPTECSVRDPKTDSRDRILCRARSFVREILSEEVDLVRFFELCKHSPGTSLGLKYSETHLTAKSQLPLTSTVEASGLFSMYLKWDTDLRSAFQYANPELNFNSRVPPIFRYVEASKMTTVPKNDETDRTIAVEPTANMFLQQGLGRLIAEKLIPFGIDFEIQQDIHKHLAFRSSVHNQNATIDFSSASDCVGIQLLRFLLPPQWFYLVDRLRCPLVDVRGALIELNCISTMGNACTFPLETLVLFCLARSVLQESENKYSFALDYADRRVSVFGDDCIMPSKIAVQFCSIAEYVGFMVNHQKSYFSDEYFRESCGGDYFHGRNVRGLYLKAPRSIKKSTLKAWLYTIFNSYLKKQISCFGTLKYVYHDQVFRLIIDKLRGLSQSIEIVPDYLPDDAGLKIVTDYSRLNYLIKGFSVKVTQDHHGTIRYNRLVSVDLDAVRKSDIFHYWFNRKTAYLSSSMLAQRFIRKEKNFESLKREGGYVIVSGQDFWSDEWSEVITFARAERHKRGKSHAKLQRRDL